MKQGRLAGLGGVAFGVLAFAAVQIGNGPGGNYSASDVAKFVERGHRPAVFVSVYLAWLAVIGLLLLLARLRSAITDKSRASIFWALSVAGAAVWVAGWALGLMVPIAMAYGGKGVVIPSGVIYLMSAGGWVVAAGGAVLVGCALLVLTLARSALPGWVRWFTFVAALAAVTAMAWFPFFLFYIWAIVIGLWLLVAERATTLAPAPAASAG
jgi:hypothetical protein